MHVEPPRDAAYEIARRLVLLHGWNSTCYQILNPGIERWISCQENAVVGFVRSSGIAVVAGAPICAEASLGLVITEWEEYCDSEGLRPCYFGAEGRMQSHYFHLPATHVVHLGSQPEWTPENLVRNFAEISSLRAQVNRAKNHGVSTRRMASEEAFRNPQLTKLLEDWLGQKGLPPLHFLVEPQTLGESRDRIFLVAEQGDTLVGCLTLCPAPARNGWLTEQFVRAPNAPNGTIELLLLFGAEALRQIGASYLTMGIVPLGETKFPPNQIALNLGAKWVRAHMNRFYNFEGLFSFKAKFRPDRWEPVVLVSPRGPVTLRQILAVVQAFTVVHPASAIICGLIRGLKIELQKVKKFIMEG